MKSLITAMKNSEITNVNDIVLIFHFFFTKNVERNALNIPIYVRLYKIVKFFCRWFFSSEDDF